MSNTYSTPIFSLGQLETHLKQIGELEKKNFELHTQNLFLEFQLELEKHLKKSLVAIYKGPNANKN